MKYVFDTPVDQMHLTTMKWERTYRDGEEDLLCMSLADGDFCAPPQLVHRLSKRAAIPHYGYVYRPDSYYQTIINWFDRHMNWQIERDWISHSYGIYPSICLMIQEFTNPGDGIIFQPPVHEVFWTVVEANGRKPVENPLVLTEDGYRMDFDDFERKIVESNVKMMILCSPHNPVGRAWTRDELTRLVEICLRHGVMIISDEVYSPLVYKGIEFTSLATVSPEASLNSITCFSPSKAFSLTGLKDSLVITRNKEYMQRFEKALVRMNMNFGANLFGTVAIECVLGECDDWVEQQLAYVQENRRFMDAYLKKHIPQIKLMPAEATCFAWLDCRRLGLDDEQLERFFEKKARVLVRPGVPMGEGGSGFVRLVLSCPRSTVEEALDRICRASADLQ
jgi:cystathionine beta-lyase